MTEPTTNVTDEPGTKRRRSRFAAAATILVPALAVFALASVPEVELRTNTYGSGTRVLVVRPTGFGSVTTFPTGGEETTSFFFVGPLTGTSLFFQGRAAVANARPGKKLLDLVEVVSVLDWTGWSRANALGSGDPSLRRLVEDLRALASASR